MNNGRRIMVKQITTKGNKSRRSDITGTPYIRYLRPRPNCMDTEVPVEPSFPADPRKN